LSSGTVTLTSSGAGNGYSGTSTVGITGTFTNIDSITANDPSVLTSTLAGSTAWAINSADGGTVTNNTHGLTFAGFGTLNGDNNADSFTFGAAGSIATINGGSGSDSLNLAALGTGTVTLTSSGTGNGYRGTCTGGLTGSFTNIGSITAADPSPLTSSLAGVTTWTISAADGGTVLNSAHS